jgi:hypothetical protein
MFEQSVPNLVQAWQKAFLFVIYFYIWVWAGLAM